MKLSTTLLFANFFTCATGIGIAVEDDDKSSSSGISCKNESEVQLASTCLISGSEDMKDTCDATKVVYGNYRSCREDFPDCEFEFPDEECAENQVFCPELECEGKPVTCEDPLQELEASFCLLTAATSNNSTDLCDVLETTYNAYKSCASSFKACNYTQLPEQEENCKNSKSLCPNLPCGGSNNKITDDAVVVCSDIMESVDAAVCLIEGIANTTELCEIVEVTYGNYGVCGEKFPSCNFTFPAKECEEAQATCPKTDCGKSTAQNTENPTTVVSAATKVFSTGNTLLFSAVALYTFLVK